MQAVESFLKDRLYGEGDTMRHLASKGFRLSYEQDPRREYDFRIQTLAVDLRNGMRLCKLVESLTGCSSYRKRTKPLNCKGTFILVLSSLRAGT